MQTISHLETDSLVQQRFFDGLSWITQLTIRIWKKFWNTLDTNQGRRYRMQHEELLRGSLSNEIRRMSWH
ncbi:hypothetical protein ACFL1S_02995 [Pseudomonadota bacterium]